MEQFTLKSLQKEDDRNRVDSAMLMFDRIKELFPESIITKDVKSLAEKLMEEQSTLNEEINERVAQLKSTLGRYWEVSQSKGDTLYWSYVIFPYRMIEANETYWFIKGYCSDDSYHSGMSDENIDYMHQWRGEDIIFKEITKEEFLEKVNAHVNEVLETRLQKIDKYKELKIE